MNIQPVAVFLVIMIALGVLGNNATITLSATILLLIQQTALSRYLPFIEKNALHAGIVLLTIGVLAPLVSGKTQLPHWSAFFHWKMLMAVVVGILVAWIAGRGVPFMGEQPILVTGLLVGTILGVSFFGGIPVGPLIAAGLLSFMVHSISG